MTCPQVLASAKGELLEPDVQENLTSSMKEVGASGDRGLTVQMIHSVAETLNEQNIAGVEAGVVLRTDMLDIMCQQAACVSNGVDGNAACAAALASVLLESADMPRKTIEAGQCVLQAMVASQIASGLVDFSSTDGAWKSPKRTTSVISSLLSAADGLTSMTDDSEEKIATQG